MGLVFFPKYSGITTIFIEKKQDKVEISNNVEKVDNTTYHLIRNIVEFLSKREGSSRVGTNARLVPCWLWALRDCRKLSFF